MQAQIQTAAFHPEDSLGGLSLRSLLTRIARELDENAIQSSECHIVVSALEEKRVSDRVSSRLQSLDLISQSLLELSVILSRIGAFFPEDMTLPEGLLNDIKLAALRDRLEGKPSGLASDGEPEIW